MFLLNVNKICLNTISLIRKLRFSGPLKKEHKILNLDAAEDDNLIQASDKDKTNILNSNNIEIDLFPYSIKTRRSSFYLF